MLFRGIFLITLPAILSCFLTPRCSFSQDKQEKAAGEILKLLHDFVLQNAWNCRTIGPIKTGTPVTGTIATGEAYPGVRVPKHMAGIFHVIDEGGKTNVDRLKNICGQLDQGEVGQLSRTKARFLGRDPSTQQLYDDMGASAGLLKPLLSSPS